MVVATEAGLNFLQVHNSAPCERVVYSEIDKIIALFDNPQTHDLNLIIIKRKGAGKSDLILDLQCRNAFLKDLIFVLKQNAKVLNGGDVDTRHFI